MRQNKKAFTIIEVSLVVSISAFFMISLMVGWSNNINNQRYNDTVNTLKSDLQGVFSDVENQTNTKLGNVKCDTSGANISLTPNTNGQKTGASDCVILGKLITLADDDKTAIAKNVRESMYGYKGILIRDVIGKDINIAKDCNGSCNNSIDALKATKFVIDAGKNKISEPKKITLEWDSQYKNITDNRESKGRPFSLDLPSNVITQVAGNINRMPDTIQGVLILRSPIDGSILSFGVPVAGAMDTDKDYNSDSFISTFRNWVIDQRLLLSNTKTVNICVRAGQGSRIAGGLAVFGRNRVIKIGPSASSVEIASLNGEGSMSCGNKAGFEDVQVNERNI